MVEPSKTTDVTFTVPADLVARLELADDAETTALDAACEHKTVANNRALAVARRELADAYERCASRVNFFPLFYALRQYANCLRTKATQNDNYAATLASRADGGDAS